MNFRAGTALAGAWAVLALATSAPQAVAQGRTGPAAAAGGSVHAAEESVRHAAARAGSTAAADSTARDSARSDSVARARVAPDTVAAAALIEAAGSSPSETTTVAAPPRPAPIFIGGRQVFRVLVGRDGLDPAQRASAIRGRINRAVADRSVPADSVRLVSTPDGVEVRLGPYFLWLITPGDANLSDPAALASELSRLPAEVAAGIERERTGRTPLRLLISTVIALALTLVAWVLARLLLVTGRRWRAWLGRNLTKRLPAIRVRNFEILSQAQMAAGLNAVLGRLDAAVGVVLVYIYLTVLFSLFPWTQGWGWLLFHFALVRVTETLRAIWEAVPGLVAIAVIIGIFRWLSHLAGRFFDAIETGTVTLAGFHPELARPSKRLVRILIWIIGAMIAYPFIPGAQSKAVQGVSILLGVMVSLGSTGFVSNMIAGLVLTYSRSFRVGDRVKIGDQVGDVVSLGFLATKLRSLRNEEVTLPNGQVVSGAIVNYSRLAEDHGLILHTQVSIGYDVDWRKVHALLIEAAGKVKGVEKEPAPYVYQRALNDFNVAYELCAVTRDSHAQLRLYSDLHAQIQDAFARAGVEILSPHYTGLRDANAPVLPSEPEGPRPEPGGFRLRPRSA